MEERFGTQRLLALRKVTRAISDLLRDEMRDYLSTLAPLVRPRGVLGDFVEGPGKESVRGADRAWKEVAALYEAVAPKPPFSLARDLKPPLDTRIACDPIVYWNRARNLCRRRDAGLVAFQDLDLFLTARRTSDGEMKRVIATLGFCARSERYDPFRHNAWILTE